MIAMSTLRAALALLGWLLIALPTTAWADDSGVARGELAPTGRLRAAINFGNPVLAQRTSDPLKPHGVSVELATELARRLALPLDFVLFNEAGEVSAALPRKVWDVAFLAIDPKRAEGISFSAPYVVIEGSYLVKADSIIASNDAVDHDGVTVGVPEGSAYDLYLSRALRFAHVLRERNMSANIDSLRRGDVPVIGGIRRPLEEFSDVNKDVRVVPGHFMVIEQAMGVPAGRPAGAALVQAFVEEMKRSGFVADALTRTGKDAAMVPR